MSTITSANSTFTLIIPGVYPVPQLLQGYAVDDAFAIDSVDIAENQMGVDGQMASGFTPYMSVMTVAFQANSSSIIIMDNWLGAMNAAREVFPALGFINYPSVRKNYALNNGVLTKAKVLADAKKVLQPVQYVITWESIVPSPV